VVVAMKLSTSVTTSTNYFSVIWLDRILDRILDIIFGNRSSFGSSYLKL
jgi:hypothetical protein